MAKIIQDDFVKNLITYLLERPAKEVISAILVLQNLPDVTVESKKEGE